jgi:hypothetical protein
METAAQIQDVNTIKFILWLSAILIGILITIVGFFLVRIVADVRHNTSNIGKNRGTIELVKQKQESDIERVDKTTQLELQNLTVQVGTLTTSVQQLVNIQLKNGRVNG